MCKYIFIQQEPSSNRGDTNRNNKLLNLEERQEENEKCNQLYIYIYVYKQCTETTNGRDLYFKFDS